MKINSKEVINKIMLTCGNGESAARFMYNRAPELWDKWYEDGASKNTPCVWGEEFDKNDNIPSFNKCCKMLDICDAYFCQSHNDGWTWKTWKDAVKFIQEHWNDSEFNIDYENDLKLED